MCHYRPIAAEDVADAAGRLADAVRWARGGVGETRDVMEGWADETDEKKTENETVKMIEKMKTRENDKTSEIEKQERLDFTLGTLKEADEVKSKNTASETVKRDDNAVSKEEMEDARLENVVKEKSDKKNDQHIKNGKIRDENERFYETGILNS